MRIATARDALEAVRQDWQALKEMPEALKTPDVCMAAVERSGWALKWIPERLKTKDVCLAAVLRDEIVMPFAPEGMQDELRRILSAGRQNERRA